MTDWLSLLEKKASPVIPGARYNAYRTEAENRGSAPDLFYEIALKPETGWEEMRDKVYPLFARYLKSKSVNPEKPDGIIVAAFYQDRCFLVDAAAFLDIFKTMEGLNSDAFHFRVLAWLAQG
jgi:hypothetical protein